MLGVNASDSGWRVLSGGSGSGGGGSVSSILRTVTSSSGFPSPLASYNNININSSDTAKKLKAQGKSRTPIALELLGINPVAFIADSMIDSCDVDTFNTGKFGLIDHLY